MDIIHFVIEVILWVVSVFVGLFVLMVLLVIITFMYGRYRGWPEDTPDAIWQRLTKELEDGDKKS
jgi:uncharacterized membrane protein YtjA (UPF0391 family)